VRLLREPLVHFFLAGGLLFGAYSWLRSGDEVAGGADRTVRITEREVSWIVETSTRQWQRAPTRRELQGLVAEYLREELLAREARELELDRDDVVVRRRLAQKMTFFLEDTSRLSVPTDAELHAIYAAHWQRYASPARASFEQIYFSADRRGERAAEDARRTLAALAERGPALDPDTLGDPSLLPPALADADELAISGQFGRDFARAVGRLSVGTWQGPVGSELGQHLVLVTARARARQRPFEEVRGALVEEWRRGREAAAKEAYFSGLLQKYDVEVAANVRPLLGPSVGAALTGAAR